MIRILLLASFVAAASTLGFACKPSECRQMQSCCDALQDQDDADDIRGACSLGDDTRDPTTCRDVTRNIEYLLEDREMSIPESCQL